MPLSPVLQSTAAPSQPCISHPSIISHFTSGISLPYSLPAKRRQHCHSALPKRGKSCRAGLRHLGLKGDTSRFVTVSVRRLWLQAEGTLRSHRCPWALPDPFRHVRTEGEPILWPPWPTHSERQNQAFRGSLRCPLVTSAGDRAQPRSCEIIEQTGTVNPLGFCSVHPQGYFGIRFFISVINLLAL